MTKRTKNTEHPHKGSIIRLSVMIVSSIVGFVLLFLGFYEPPRGIIHPTVLIAFGELATFASALLWIDYYYVYEKSIKDKDD